MEGNQLAELGDGVDFTVGHVVGHVVQDHAQVGDVGGVGQVVLRHDVQLALVGGGEDVMLGDGGGVEDVIGEGHTGSTDLVVVLKSLVEAAPVTGDQVVGHHLRQVSGLTDLHLDHVGGPVHGVVEDLQQELLAVDGIQGEGVLRSLALGDLVALSGTLQGEVGGQGHAAVLPAQSTVVVGHVDGTGGLVHDGLAGGFVGDGQAGVVGIADGDEADAVDGIAAVDGVALRHVPGVGHHGVAAEGVVVAGVPVIHDLEIVAAGTANVGDPGILAGGVGGPLADVEHAGIGPVAVEAQHGDGVGGVLGGGVEEALDVGTVGVALVQHGLALGGDIELDQDLHGTAGGQSSGGGGQVLQEDVCIVGVDVAVAVHVCVVLVIQGGDDAGGVIQQSLAVGVVHDTVAIEVTAGHLLVDGYHAADVPCNVHGQCGGGVVQVAKLAVGGQSLHEEVRAQVQGLPA